MTNLETTLLHHLWRTPATTIAALSQALHSSPENIHTALASLESQACLFDRTPTSLELLRVGLPCWRDLLEHHAKATYSSFAHTVHIYQQTASTNDLALRAAQDGAAPGLLILADEQTTGRGRRGHSWLAKRGQSILLSLLLPPSPNTDDRLTLLAGLALAQALENAGLPAVHIKWPNDILIENKKIAGILVETKNNATVLGLGINVSQSTDDFPPNLRDRATSIYLATGQIPDRLRILEKLLPTLETYCTQNPPPEARWLEAWRSRCSMLGKPITAFTTSPSGTQQTITGRVLDIDPLKGLLLRDSTGALIWLNSQTTTLSPL